MFVILNEVSPRVVGPITLKPKLNKGVSDSVWAQVSTWGSVRSLCTHRLIEELAEDAPSLEGLQVAAAILVVTECDFDQFLRWQKVETRGPVLHAMKKRLDALKSPVGQDSVAARAFAQGVTVDEVRKQDASYGVIAERLAQAEATISDQARYIRALEARLGTAKHGAPEVTSEPEAVTPPVAVAADEIPAPKAKKPSPSRRQRAEATA